MLSVPRPALSRTTHFQRLEFLGRGRPFSESLPMSGDSEVAFGTEARVKTPLNASPHHQARNCCQSVTKINNFFEEAKTNAVIRHFSLIPTAHAALFLPLTRGLRGKRSSGRCPPISTASASAECCQQTSSSSTTQRTTHFLLRQRYRTFSAKRRRRFRRST